MSARLPGLVEPATTTLLTQECQRGVIGAESVLPELAVAARESGMVANVARLVEAARDAGVPVVHAIAQRRADGRGSNTNARLFRATERNPEHLTVGSPLVELVDDIPPDDSDIVSTRLHGLSPIAGTDVGAM